MIIYLDMHSYPCAFIDECSRFMNVLEFLAIGCLCIFQTKSIMSMIILALTSVVSRQLNIMNYGCKITKLNVIYIYVYC